MALARATIKKSVMGNKRVHFGTCTAASGDTTGTLDTGLRTVEAFMMNMGLIKYTVSSGVVTVTFVNPAANAGTGGWMAIGY